MGALSTLSIRTQEAYQQIFNHDIAEDARASSYSSLDMEGTLAGSLAGAGGYLSINSMPAARKCKSGLVLVDCFPPRLLWVLIWPQRGRTPSQYERVPLTGMRLISMPRPTTTYVADRSPKILLSTLSCIMVHGYWSSWGVGF